VDVAWSSTNGRLATVSRDRTTRVWDVHSGIELAVLRGHQDTVRSVAWSPDGHQLVTGSDDQTARVWDVHGGMELAVLRGHQDTVWGVAWSPHGQRIATACGDQTIRIWDVAPVSDVMTDLDALVAKARNRVFRELNADERRTVMLPELPALA
jgi:WD40 repeat protein